MAIDKHQWRAIEQELTRSYCHVKFQLGEHTLEVVRERYSESEYHLVVYVDGKFNPNWGWPSGDKYWPLVEQIWRKRTVHRYSAVAKKRMVKSFGKRRVKELFPDLDAKRHWYEPNFPTAKPLLGKLKKLADLTWVTDQQPEVANG